MVVGERGREEEKCVGGTVEDRRTTRARTDGPPPGNLSHLLNSLVTPRDSTGGKCDLNDDDDDDASVNGGGRLRMRRKLLFFFSSIVVDVSSSLRSKN